MTSVHSQEEFISLPPPASANPSVYAFSMHKGGSTLLFSILQELAPSIGLSYFSLPDELFRLGFDINEPNPSRSRYFLEKGYIYGGFRLPCPDIPDELLKNSRKVVLLRNPLDALVSLYYSITRSHVKPGDSRSRAAAKRFERNRNLASSMDIDAFAIQRSEKQHRTLKSYLDMAHDPLTAVYMYEDVIYRKADFIESICNHFGWTVSDKTIREIAARHDTFPDKENPDNHIRQVHPGNYRKHLSKQTICSISSKMDPVMSALQGHRQKLPAMSLGKRLAIWKLRRATR